MEIGFYIFMIIVGLFTLILLWAIFTIIRDSYRKSRDKRRERERIQDNYRLVEVAEDNTAAVLAELHSLPDEKARIECLRCHSEKVFLTEGWYWRYYEGRDCNCNDMQEHIVILGHKNSDTLGEVIVIPANMDFGGITLKTVDIPFGQRLSSFPESIDITRTINNALQIQLPEGLSKVAIRSLIGFPRLKTFKVPPSIAYPYFLISDCKELETVEFCDESQDFKISQCPKLRKLIFPSYQYLLHRYSSMGPSEYDDYGLSDEYEETMKALFETEVNPDSGIELSIEFANGDSFGELHVPDPLKDREEYEFFMETSSVVWPERVRSIVFPENLRWIIKDQGESVSIHLYDEEARREDWKWQMDPDSFSYLESITFPNEVWILDWYAEDGAVLFPHRNNTPYVRITPANVARYEKRLGIKINIKS